MRSLLRLIRTASPQANQLTLLALALLVVKTFVLNRFAARFLGAYEAGVIVEAVLASVVASYIFYLVVVHLKEAADRAVVQPYIAKHSARVVGDCEAQLTEIGKIANIGLSLSTASLSDIEIAFGKVPMASDAPLVLTPQMRRARWIEYFEFYSRRSRGSIARVLAQLLYLEARHVGLLTSIDDCAHFNSVDTLRNLPLTNSSLADFAPSFFKYCEACKTLSLYLKAIADEESP